MKVQVRRLHSDLPLPEYASQGSAGLDLRAALDAPYTLAPGERRLVPTGLEIALPPGTEAQVRPRSGLAFKHGVTVLNSPGTIDSDYRGEIGVILVNLGTEPFCGGANPVVIGRHDHAVHTLDLAGRFPGSLDQGLAVAGGTGQFHQRLAGIPGRGIARGDRDQNAHDADFSTTSGE